MNEERNIEKKLIKGLRCPYCTSDDIWISQTEKQGRDTRWDNWITIQKAEFRCKKCLQIFVV